MNTKHWKEIQTVMKELGIAYTADTGGWFFPKAKGTVHKNPFSSEIKINFHSGQSFSCLSADIFLKSLREAESSFKIKLFVNA